MGLCRRPLYRLGQLFHDPSQSPHKKTADIDKAFGVGTSTASAKATFIRKLIDFGPFDLAWTLPSRMEQNPLIWVLTVNGIPLDIRRAPRAAQQEAYKRVLITYIPADRPK